MFLRTPIKFKKIPVNTGPERDTCKKCDNSLFRREHL